MILQLAVISLFVGTCSTQNGGYSRDNPSNPLNYDSNSKGYGKDDESRSNGGEIPGEAGVDYPVYDMVPDTGFSCQDQQYPGYYADPKAQCQAFYICQKGGRSDGFLCPIGTIFNQEHLVCDWWYNADCSKAEDYYSVNELITRAMDEATERLKQQQKNGGYDYKTPSKGSQNGAYDKMETNSYQPKSDRLNKMRGSAGRTIIKTNKMATSGMSYSDAPRSYLPPNDDVYNQKGNNDIRFNPQAPNIYNGQDDDYDPNRRYLPTN